MTTRSLIQIIAAMLAAVPAGAQGGTVEGCSARAEPARRVELPDGRPVSVDVQSLARRGDTVMVIGRYVYVFAAPSTPLSPPVMQDSIMGFTLSGGKTSLVHAPLRARTVFFPKVAAGADGFHFLFATGDDTTLKSIAQDSATIWYVRFADGVWSTPERVTSVSRVKLNPESTSALLERRGALSFAFTFGDTMEDEGGGGVVLLRRREGTWSADTLRTQAKPTAVRLAFGATDGLLKALIPLRDPRSSSAASQLMLAAFGSEWHDARVIAETRRGVMMPSLATLGDGYVASWSTWEFSAESSTIEWVRIGRDGRVVTGPVIATGANAFPFEMIVAENTHPIWFFHGTPFGMVVSVVTATDSGVTPLDDLTVPFENPKVASIPIDRARVLAFTMKQGKAPDEPMVASYATVLEIRCPRSARR